MDYFHVNKTPGISWLHRIAERFPRSAWLNPSPERFWGVRSTHLIREVFEMYTLTLDGLEAAVKDLRNKTL